MKMKRKYSILTLFTLLVLHSSSAQLEAASSLDKIDVAETEQKLEMVKLVSVGDVGHDEELLLVKATKDAQL